MKKILILMTLIMAFATQLSAQSEHFTFRDIPIDGTLEEFGERLSELGYFQYAPNIYKGKFIGDDCSIYILNSDYSDIVYRVVVNFDPETSWSSLKYDFRKIKELCTSKYGKPSKTLESFDRPYYDGDGYEMSAVKLGKCNYFCQWDTGNGEVSVIVMKDGSIAIYYTDKNNMKIEEQAKNKTAESEI